MIETAEPIFLVSPSEPPSLRAIGEVSSAVEKKGCDVLVVLPSLRIGIQRKTWIDLVISLDDGRLAGSIPKMDMAIRMVIIEGTAQFDRDHHMVVRSNNRHAKGGYMQLRHTRESLLGVQFSLRYHHGLDVVRTENLTETVRVVQRIGNYLGKRQHKGVVGARTAATGTASWGQDKAERQFTQRVNFLMGAGIGQRTAENLIRANGGRLPLRWTMTKEQMLEVRLIGESLADRLERFLG